jgi:hypothetical protein
MKRLALLLALACGTAAGADAPDPARLKEARALLESMHLERQLDNTAKIMADSMSKSLSGEAKGNPRVAQVFVEEAMAGAKASMTGPDGFLETMAGFYATEFSVQELRQIRAYYESPVGQHMLDAQPKLMQQALPKIMESMRARMPAICDMAKVRLIAEKVDNAEKIKCPAP